MLLGAGELGKELTISLKRLGCEVIACDSYEGAPAMQVTSQHRVFDMTDAQALQQAIAEVEPDLIVPEVEKLAIEALQEAARAGRKVVPSAQVVARTFDRQGIRTLAATQAQVPTSAFAFASSLEELAAGAAKVGFPCYVKPTMSSSGHGQSRVSDPSDIPSAWENAASGARAETGRVIVESEVNFDFEITLLTVRHWDGERVVTSFCAPIGHRQEGGDYVESWQPQEMDPQVLVRAQQVAKAVTDALAADTDPAEGPVLGIFGVELFIRGQEVLFSELSPRPHDTGLVTLASQYQSEFDLHARAILGLPLSTNLLTPAASAAFKSPAEVSDPVYQGVAEALAYRQTDVRLFGKPEAHPGRRMGVVLTRAAEVKTAREIATQARQCLQVRSADEAGVAGGEEG